MDRKELDPGQCYGYAVCLVAVLILVFGTRQLVQSNLDLRELQYSEAYTNGPSLVSLGAYRLDLLKRLELQDPDGVEVAVLPTDEEFQQMFEQERLYRLALSHQVNRSRMIVSLALLGVAFLLFASHWIWLQRRERAGSPDRDRGVA